MTEALAYELRPFGVRVMSVEPGMINTDFSKATRRTGAAATGEGPYGPLSAKMRDGYGRWRALYPTDADEVAREVLAAAEDPDATFQRLVGRDAEVLMGLRPPPEATIRPGTGAGRVPGDALGVIVVAPAPSRGRWRPPRRRAPWRRGCAWF